jgi:hypothetical protein
MYLDTKTCSFTFKASAREDVTAGILSSITILCRHSSSSSDPCEHDCTSEYCSQLIDSHQHYLVQLVRKCWGKDTNTSSPSANPSRFRTSPARLFAALSLQSPIVERRYAETKTLVTQGIDANALCSDLHFSSIQGCRSKNYIRCYT